VLAIWATHCLSVCLSVRLSVCVGCSAINGGRARKLPTAPTGAVYGERAVRFHDDGRPLFTGHTQRQPGSSNMLFWRRKRQPADRPAAVDAFQYRPYSRRTVLPPGRSRLAPFVTRRIDTPTAFDSTTGITTMKPEMIVVEEMKIYDEKPWGWWLFIMLAILMFVLGVLNVIWCWQYHWYSRFWAALLVCIYLLLYRYVCIMLITRRPVLFRTFIVKIKCVKVRRKVRYYNFQLCSVV